MTITVLTKRADFLAANRGLRNARPGFVLLTRPNQGHGVRFGITVTKKVGNAVVRNRIKRRLREIARLKLEDLAQPGYDYVLIGRSPALSRLFTDLEKDLYSALKRLHRTSHQVADKGTP